MTEVARMDAQAVVRTAGMGAGAGSGSGRFAAGAGVGMTVSGGCGAW